MTRLMQVRVVAAVIGVVVWGYGVATENSIVRLVGIGLLVVALVLRFARRRSDPTPESDSNTGM
jgi:membrane protein implicated in regulation of membrane protease activity